MTDSCRCRASETQVAEVYIGKTRLYFAGDKLPFTDDKLPQNTKEAC